MHRIDQPWRAETAVNNAHGLRAAYAPAFTAMGDIDALGHRLLRRVGEGADASSVDDVVGLALLRRSVMLMANVRPLFENAAVESAKLLLRAQLELMLGIRYLVHGGRRHITLDTQSNPRGRQVRARYYFAEYLRRKVYRIYAVRDGRWGKRPRSTKERRALVAEAQEVIQKLDRTYPAQQRRYGRLRCLPGRPGKAHYYDEASWYSFGFTKRRVNSVRALALQLGYLPVYETLYDAFSGIAHARGIEHDLNFTDDTIEVLSPHLVDAFGILCFYSCAFQSLNLVFMAKAYHRGSIDDAQRVYVSTTQHLDCLDTDVPMGFYG